MNGKSCHPQGYKLAFITLKNKLCESSMTNEAQEGKKIISARPVALKNGYK
jgi:hypothetical protein